MVEVCSVGVHELQDVPWIPRLYHGRWRALYAESITAGEVLHAARTGIDVRAVGSRCIGCCSVDFIVWTCVRMEFIDGIRL